APPRTRTPSFGGVIRTDPNTPNFLREPIELLCARLEHAAPDRFVHAAPIGVEPRAKSLVGVEPPERRPAHGHVTDPASARSLQHLAGGVMIRWTGVHRRQRRKPDNALRERPVVNRPLTV